MRLRQIAVVAADLEAVLEQLCTVFGVELCHRDPKIAQFGLHNALVPIGNQFLEVVSPLAGSTGTAGERFLQRRGDGGYMVICQTDDFDTMRRRVDALGVRLVHAFEVPGDIIDMQLHPKDTGGTLFEVDQILAPGGDALDGPWRYAGPDWQRARRTDRVGAIRAAQLDCQDPMAVAQRWGQLLGSAPQAFGTGASLALDNAVLRFVAHEGRPEGLGAIDVSCADVAAVLAAATRAGLEHTDGSVTVAGLRCNLVPVGP